MIIFRLTIYIIILDRSGWSILGSSCRTREFPLNVTSKLLGAWLLGQRRRFHLFAFLAQHSTFRASYSYLHRQNWKAVLWLSAFSMKNSQPWCPNSLSPLNPSLVRMEPRHYCFVLITTTKARIYRDWPASVTMNCPVAIRRTSQGTRRCCPTFSHG